MQVLIFQHSGNYIYCLYSNFAFCLKIVYGFFMFLKMNWLFP
jgi:hypothetical protein